MLVLRLADIRFCFGVLAADFGVEGDICGSTSSKTSPTLVRLSDDNRFCLGVFDTDFEVAGERTLAVLALCCLGVSSCSGIPSPISKTSTELVRCCFGVCCRFGLFFADFGVFETLVMLTSSNTSAVLVLGVLAVDFGVAVRSTSAESLVAFGLLAGEDLKASGVFAATSDSRDFKADFGVI